MPTTIYVLRAFGGVLIVQSAQQATSVPTVTVVAYTRDGIVKAQTRPQARTP